MTFGDRTYPDIVRDLLTVLTGGTVAETHAIGATVPDAIHLDHRPVRRVSHLQGKVETGDGLADYRFTERDFELVGTEASPSQFVAIRFRARGAKPAPNTSLTVNYYPDRLRPTPLTDVNVGSVVRTLLETVSRELATQYLQLQRVYESAFVETASGEALDRVAALVDTPRLRQGHAVGKVRFSRRAGSPGSIYIPISTAVSDGAGQRYLTSHEVTLLENQATAEVWVAGQTPRTEPVADGALTVLERAIAGIDRVRNDEPTYRATDDETDDQLRARARRAIHAAGKGTVDALRYGLEAFPFVSAVGIAEHPDPSVPVPGMLRIDVALTQDDPVNRRAVDRRVEELRPAGIYVERHWAGKVALGFRVSLVVSGATLPAGALADLEDALAERLVRVALDLGPGEVLRRARLVAAALEDARVVDARIEITADGAAIAGDTWTLPAGQAPAADPSAVAFTEVRFEEAEGAAAPEVVQVEADLVVTSLKVAPDALQASRKAALETFFAGPGAAKEVTFDQLASALRDDAQFALVRSESVFALDQEGAGFTELRDGDPPFTVPAGAAVRVRAVRVREAKA